jgi:magnesium chelatase family protein
LQNAKQKTYCNAEMTSGQIRAHCELSHECERLLERAMTQQGLSARAHDRILKVARTIADLESVAGIEPKHIAEAIQYRTLDRTYWACSNLPTLKVSIGIEVHSNPAISSQAS